MKIALSRRALTLLDAISGSGPWWDLTTETREPLPGGASVSVDVVVDELARELLAVGLAVPAERAL